MSEILNFEINEDIYETSFTKLFDRESFMIKDTSDADSPMSALDTIGCIVQKGLLWVENDHMTYRDQVFHPTDLGRALHRSRPQAVPSESLVYMNINPEVSSEPSINITPETLSFLRAHKLLFDKIGERLREGREGPTHTYQNEVFSREEDVAGLIRLGLTYRFFHKDSKIPTIHLSSLALWVLQALEKGLDGFSVKIHYEE